MKRVLTRAIASIVFAVFLMSAAFAITSAGVFFSNIANGVSNIDTLSENDLEKNLPINGKVYYVNTLLAEEYNDEDSLDVENYYYLISMNTINEVYLIVKTSAYSSLDIDLENLYYADVPGGEDYEYLLYDGVSVDGVLVDNNSDVVNEYEKWKDRISSEYGEDMSNAILADYTLDCTETVSSICTRFIVSSVILFVFLGVLIFFIVVLVKQSKAGGMQTPAYSNGYGQPNGFVPNGSGVPQNNYIQNSSDIQQNGYAPNASSNGQFIPQNGQSFIPQSNYNQNAQSFIPQSNYNQNPQSFIPQSNYDQDIQSSIPQNPTINANLMPDSQNDGSIDRVSLKKEDQ